MTYLILTPEVKSIVCRDYPGYYRLCPVNVGEIECLPVGVLDIDAYAEVHDILITLSRIEVQNENI